MSAKKKAYDDRPETILKSLLERDGNRSCADCENPFPSWTSWTLGIFICFRCAGLHRGLGVHISRVKSISLDQWTPQQVARMAQVGNKKAAQVYEAQLSASFHRPEDPDDLKMFLQMKYVHKIYMSLSMKLEPMPRPDLTFEELEQIVSDDGNRGEDFAEHQTSKTREQTAEDTSDSEGETELLIAFDESPSHSEKAEPPVTYTLPLDQEGEGDGVMATLNMLSLDEQPNGKV